MSCCKDNLLVYVVLGDDQKTDQEFISKVKQCLKETLEFPDEQVSQVVDYAKKNGKCLIFEGNKEEVSAITLSLAKLKISADVRTKSIK